MPIKNGIEFIDESVSSIIAQTYRNWELIIGINGHQPASEVYKIAKQYELRDSRIKVIELSPLIIGKPAALNEMVQHHCSPESEWISVLDVDDIWMKSKLESQIPYMSSYDVIGTQCVYFGDKNTICVIPVGDLSSFNFIYMNPIINSSCLVKRALCKWNDEFLEDYELWLRLWNNGARFFNVSSIQVRHRIHKNSAFNSKGDQNVVNKLRKKYKALKFGK